MKSANIKRNLERWAIVRMFVGAFSIGLGLTLYHLAGFAACLAEFDSSKVLHATLASSLALPALGILQVKLLDRISTRRNVFLTFGLLFLVGVILWAATGLYGSSVAPAVVFFSKILSAFSFLGFMKVLRENLPGAQNSGLKLIISAGFPAAQIAGGFLAPTLFASLGNDHGAGLGIILILIGAMLALGAKRSQPVTKCKSEHRPLRKREKNELKGKETLAPPSTFWIVVLTVTFALACSLTGNLYSQSANSLAVEPGELTRKLALVDSICGIFQLLAMTCLGGRLLRSLGAEKCLLIMPAMMLICGLLLVALSAVGLPAQQIFWLAAFAWMGEAVGKSSIHRPAMGVILELLYDAKTRDRLHSTLGTVVQPISRIVAGLLLVSLGDRLKGDLQFSGFILLLLSACWLFAAWRLARCVSRRHKSC